MPLSPERYPAKSPLIAPELEDQLKTLLDKLSAPVTLVCVLDEGEKSAEMAAFVNGILGSFVRSGPLPQTQVAAPAPETFSPEEGL